MSLEKTPYYDNYLNFLTRHGHNAQDIVLNRESLQSGSNNECNFIYNSPYHCCGFVQCGYLRFTTSKQRPYKALQPARSNRPMILIIIPLGVPTVISRGIADGNRERMFVSFSRERRLNVDRTRSSCVKQQLSAPESLSNVVAPNYDRLGTIDRS